MAWNGYATLLLIILNIISGNLSLPSIQKIYDVKIDIIKLTTL